MPRAKAATPSHEIFQAALEGLEAQREKLDQQIAEVRRVLGSRAGRKTNSGGSETNQAAPRKGRKKRTLSPEARKKIAAAQKKRWAQFRKSEG
jgi:hypothetical protein